MASNYENVNNLKVKKNLLRFVNEDLLEGTHISSEKFWLGFDNIVHELSPKNKELIEFRDILQRKIDNMGQFLDDPRLIQMAMDETSGEMPIDEDTTIESINEILKDLMNSNV